MHGAPEPAPAPASAGAPPSWLARDELERARFVDMHARLRPASFKTVALIALLYLPVVPTMAAWSFLPLGLALACFVVTVTFVVPRASRPEVATFAGLLAAQPLMATAVVVNDHHHSGGLAILAWPVVGVCAGFAPRVVAAFTGYTAAVLVGASLAWRGHVALEDPATLAAPLAVVVAVAVLVTALLRSDIHHRGAASIDALTGTFNRTALASRTADLEALTRATPDPVAVVVGDVDHFKHVNDTAGHETGDAVLREIAGVLRHELRTADHCYRLGGEEFAIVLAGAGLQDGLEIAERLRAAIAAAPVGGLPVTMSFGVAATGPDEPFVWSTLYRKADAALYAAKARGRDRVVAQELHAVA